MRIARVIGNLTLARRLNELPAGNLLLVEVLDRTSLAQWPPDESRRAPVADSLVVFDQLGAGLGQIIAVSEGREACMPFYPTHVPIDAFNTAILDQVECTGES